ncbi:F0F1 ATP synthase subunit A [Candidatus Peregrinibacteria bacterium]|nr:F0F1 ATP synthase subunit A [Candidatus Peregrinibacteria bacterium]
MASFIPVPPLSSETLFHIGEFGVRNTLIMAWMAMAVLFVVALLGLATGYKLTPRGRFQVLLEMIVGGLHDFFDSIFQNEKMTRRFFPLLASIFLFIIIGNWMGILPGVGSITIEGLHNGEIAAIPLFRSMNADVNMTLVFAIVAIIFTQVVGLATIGIFPHAGKYFVMPWKKPYVLGTFIGILEFIGEFARIISFTFRLFGNIFAGEVLLVVVSSLVPYLVPIPFLGLEIFVGFIQAMVFSMLTAVFILMAMQSHGEGAH